jgi:hypothetical protein
LLELVRCGGNEWGDVPKWSWVAIDSYDEVIHTMGVTVYYRGCLDDLDRVEDFEDRVLDLAFNLGGEARIWRSVADDQSGRMVRGVTLDLYPGQETISLLISPEGWLIGLLEIEQAEMGEIDQPPWCFVKTQFGAIEGHVVLVELLAALKQHFISNLEIRDDGQYWPDRDLTTLRQKFATVQAAIDGLAEGLRQYGLSPEAAEDPEILTSRIERVAALVHRTLSRPAEHATVVSDDDDSEYDPSEDEPEGTEQDWDDAHRANRRRQERLHRAIQERLSRGEDPHEAFHAAMGDIGLPDLREELARRRDEEDEFQDESDDDEDAPWRESLPDALRNEEYETRIDRHPLQKQALDLELRLYHLLELDDRRNAHLELLYRGLGDLAGGLVQALGCEDWQPPPSLAVPQLKRALRGAAYAQGALFSLRAEEIASEEVFNELHGALKTLEDGTLDQLRRIREAREE